MITDPLFYVCAVPAVLIFGLAKGGFGGVMGIVSVPIMALAIPPPQAAAILLPILCVMDLLAVHKYWRCWDSENLRILLPAIVAGIGLGSLSFSYLTEDHIRILIGLLAVGFAVTYWKSARSQPKQHPNRLKGGFWGTLAGFTSFGIHSGSPPISVYLIPQRLQPTVFVGTCTILFTVANYLKIIPYYLLGQLNSNNLWTSLVLLPLAPIGITIGYKLQERISSQRFYSLFNIFLLITGFKLLYDGTRSF